MTPSTGVGQRVRELRLRHGLSQTELGGGTLSASYVSLIESGKRVPSGGVLAQLAATLGCSVEHLRDGIESSEAAQIRLELSWAELALRQGSADQALRLVEPLLQLERILDLDLWRARMLAARAHEALGQFEDSIVLLERLRSQSEDSPGQWPWLSVVVALCRCYREAGDLSFSVELAESALQRVLVLELAGSDEHAELTATLVASYDERGDLVRAGLLARELLASTEHCGPRAQAAAYWSASVVAHEQGRTGDAVQLSERALARFAESDQGRDLARLRATHAGLLVHADPAAAATALEVLRDAGATLGDIGTAVDRARVETETARVLLVLHEAASAADVARAVLHRLGDEPRLETARALIVLARARCALGDAEEAAARLRHAGQLLDQAPAGRQSAAAWTELGEVLATLGEHGEAVRALQRALAAAGVRTAPVDRAGPSGSSGGPAWPAPPAPAPAG